MRPGTLILGPCWHQALGQGGGVTGGHCGFAPSWALSMSGRGLFWSLISPWPCAIPEAAGQRGPPVSSCPLILMAGHLERGEICLPSVFLASACQGKRRWPQGWGHSCASGPCSTDPSREKRGLRPALWSSGFVTLQRKHRGNSPGFQLACHNAPVVQSQGRWSNNEDKAGKGSLYPERF